MDVHRLTLLALPLAASLVAACGEAQAPVAHTASPAPTAPPRARPFHMVALGTETSVSPGLHVAADLVPDAETTVPPQAVWGAGLRPGRGASGISP